MKHRGFTLAEVLITLGIIGVVAAMTIPTLIANTNSQKFRVQYKKTISTMNQAVRMAMAKYDVDFSAVKATCSDSPQTDTAEDNATVCGILNTTLSGVTYIQNLFGDYAIDDNEEEAIWLEGDVWYAYHLADGSIFAILQEDKYCTKDDPCLGFIDVNGRTKPNKQVHGVEVTAYNGIFSLPVYGKCNSLEEACIIEQQPKVPKFCVPMECMRPAVFDPISCRCIGDVVINPGIGGGGGAVIKPPSFCETACGPGFTQTGKCKCVANEPDPSPDPTYNVPADINHLTDVYPVAIYDHTVMPASRAAWYVLSTTKSASTPSKSSLANSKDDTPPNEEAGTINSFIGGETYKIKDTYQMAK